MVRIRQATEANEFAQALTIAETELKAIEDEPAFDNSHEESAALLPANRRRPGQASRTAPPTSDDSKKLVDLANKALELCNNVAYVPKTLRDETQLANVREALRTRRAASAIPSSSRRSASRQWKTPSPPASRSPPTPPT